MKRLIGLFALLVLSALPAAAQQTPTFDLRRRLSLPLVLSSERSALRHERMECSPGLQHQELDRGRGRSQRNVSKSGNERKNPDLHFHGGSTDLSIRPSPQVDSVRRISFRRRLRQPYFPAEFRLPANHFLEHGFRVGGRRWSAVESETEMGDPFVEFDYEQTRFSNYPNQTTGTQGNYRISVGVVYHIGEK